MPKKPLILTIKMKLIEQSLSSLSFPFAFGVKRMDNPGGAVIEYDNRRGMIRAGEQWGTFLGIIFVNFN